MFCDAEKWSEVYHVIQLPWLFRLENCPNWRPPACVFRIPFNVNESIGWVGKQEWYTSRSCSDSHWWCMSISRNIPKCMLRFWNKSNSNFLEDSQQCDCLWTYKVKEPQLAPNFENISLNVLTFTLRGHIACNYINILLIISL